MGEQIYPRMKSQEDVRKDNVRGIGTHFGEVVLDEDDIVEAGNSVGQDFTDLTREEPEEQSKDNKNLN